MARKLGLAPQRTSLDARLSKLRTGGVATPPRTSIDGILHALQQGSARSSLDQQQALLQQAMNGQQQLAMSGERPSSSQARWCCEGLRAKLRAAPNLFDVPLVVSPCDAAH